MDIKSDIEEWINTLSARHILLGGLSVCPFAKSAEYEIIKTDGSDINPPPWHFDLLIYHLPDDWTRIELFELAEIYNKMFPDMVFLPDHKDRYTEINGVQTNNGKHNLILCQWRDELNKARSKLSSTAYYTFWNQEYLNEILKQ